MGRFIDAIRNQGRTNGSEGRDTGEITGASIRIEGFTKTFGRTEVLRGIDLEVPAGSLCVLVGPSGCGKSTLLRLIAGLETPTSGTLYIGGERADTLRPAERGVAMVFQNYALYPHMTVYENIAFGLRGRGRRSDDIDQRVREAAHMLQIDAYLERLPKQLSGGQRQRVAIGRAIARRPRVLLFDEPLSNLDAALRVRMRAEISALHRRIGSTIVYVTHDQVEAMTLADTIVLMNQGHIEQSGAPLELYHHPRTRFVGGFLGSPPVNFLPASVSRIEGRRVTLRVCDQHELDLVLAEERALSERVELGIRPEDLTLEPDAGGGGVVGTVQLVEQLGDGAIVHLLVDGKTTPALYKHAGGASLRVGERCRLRLPLGACHLFDDGLVVEIERGSDTATADVDRRAPRA